MKLKFSRHIFEKYSNIKFDGKPSIGSRVDPRGQTDRSDEASGRFSQICERAENWLQTKCATDKPVVCLHFRYSYSGVWERSGEVTTRGTILLYRCCIECKVVGGGIEIQLHSFVTSESDGSEWSASRPGLFTLEVELRYPLNKSLCGPGVVGFW